VVETHKNPVVVQRDSVILSLTCSAQTAMDYCWFRHPSGFPLLFSTENVLEGNIWLQYKYEDALQGGVCTIVLEFPSINRDSGVWTCNVGFLEHSNEEYTKPITVGFSGTVEKCL
jgi:hypothetical protein